MKQPIGPCEHEVHRMAPAGKLLVYEPCGVAGVVEINNVSYCRDHLDQGMRGATHLVKAGLRHLVGGKK